MDRLKESYKNATPPVPILLEYLREAVVRCGYVYVLFDALDESPTGFLRDEVLLAIKSMREWQLPGLHVLVTSRDIPEIRDQLVTQGGQYVTLENESVQQDISRYVLCQVDDDRQLQRWGYHREKIKSYLTRHAGGV